MILSFCLFPLFWSGSFSFVSFSEFVSLVLGDWVLIQISPAGRGKGTGNY